MNRGNLSENESVTLNLITFCAKSFIWSCKENKTNINVNRFMINLEEELAIVKQTGPIHREIEKGLYVWYNPRICAYYQEQILDY